MQNAFLSVLLALIGYSVQAIAQATQKIGLELQRRRPWQGWVLWAFATAMTSVTFFVILAAISLGSVSLVGAMAGTGLAALAVFSHVVMHEKLQARELVMLLLIVVGAAMVGAFAGRQATGMGDAQGPLVRLRLLWGILAGGTTLYVAAWIITRRMGIVGAVVGGFSGFLGAYSQLFQEFGTSSAPLSAGTGAFIGALIRDPITLVWIALSVISMLVLQFSYRHGRAIQIIPSFTGNIIVVPVIGGLVIFNQNLLAVQWIGVVLIAVGSIALARGESEDELAGAVAGRRSAGDARTGDQAATHKPGAAARAGGGFSRTAPGTDTTHRDQSSGARRDTSQPLPQDQSHDDS